MSSGFSVILERTFSRLKIMKSLHVFVEVVVGKSLVEVFVRLVKLKGFLQWVVHCFSEGFLATAFGDHVVFEFFFSFVVVLDKKMVFG